MLPAFAGAAPLEPEPPFAASPLCSSLPAETQEDTGTGRSMYEIPSADLGPSGSRGGPSSKSEGATSAFAFIWAAPERAGSACERVSEAAFVREAVKKRRASGRLRL